MSASIVVAALYPKGCEATHCRRFFSLVAWDFAEMMAGYRSTLRDHQSRHCADVDS